MEKEKRHLKELAQLFFKLGCIGFGGPAVHIALMEEEVVRKRKWFSAEHFLDMVGATNLIPGPNSTEMTMHIGHERAGWKGLVAAGLSFILPAVLITGVFAWAYRQYGKLPEVAPFIYGIKPAIISVIVSLMIALGRKALKSIEVGILGFIAGALAFYGINEILLLFSAGFTGVLLFLYKPRNRQSANSVFPLAFLHLGTFSSEPLIGGYFGSLLKSVLSYMAAAMSYSPFLIRSLLKPGS
ncbi:chromate transporter [Sphingobacterium siyangense]|uniref:chromate transporter n=1 Tax=Sphingobacterium siyangense TaxID=459529 RepID=UPI003DA53B41